MEPTLARVPGGYIAFHDDRVIVEVSDAAARWLGYPRDELVGRSLSHLVSAAGRVFLETALFPMLAVQGSAEEIYLPLRTRAGGELPVLLFGHREEIDGRWLNRCVFLPMRRRQVAESELTAAISFKEKAEAQLAGHDRLAALGALTASIGHEINNPLAYVSGNLYLLDEALRGDEVLTRRPELTGLLREAVTGCDRIGAIVANLRKLARPEGEHREIIELDAAVDLALRMTAHELRHRARLLVERGLAPRVEADPGRLSQVFINLLINAGQAFPAGSSERNVIRVVTRASERGDAVAEVIDNGPGVPEALRERIFEPFFTTKAVGDGTGLGLSVCHGIVTSFGGTLTCEPAPGGGACFRIVLPASRAVVGTQAPLPITVQASPIAPRRAKVLVIDDEPAVGNMITRMLRGHDATAFSRAADALAAIAGGARYDLVLCDLMMPDMGGVEVYAAVARAAPELAERIVFMTGGVFDERVEAFLATVSNKQLAKPFRAEALRAICEAALRGEKTSGT